MSRTSIGRKGLVIGIVLSFIGINLVQGNTGSKSQNVDAVNEEMVFNRMKPLFQTDNLSWQWAVDAGGIEYDTGTGVVVDLNGNTYITGVFQNSVMFGSIMLTSQGSSDVFVAKLNNNGEWQWAVRAGGTGQDGGANLAVNTNDNIYVTGYFSINATFGNTTLTSNGILDLFVAKLSSDGEWQWTVSVGGTNYDIGSDIAVDANGNTYITGYFMNSVTFGTTVLTSQGNKDVYVAKLNSDGVWQWAISAGGSGEEWGYGITLDTTSNIYFTGIFWGSATFGSTVLTTQGDSDVFVVKLNNDGAWLWVASGGGPDYDDGFSIAVDGNQNVYITGEFKDTAIFGNISLPSPGFIVVFIAQLNSVGEWQWAVGAGGSGDDGGNGIAVDANRNVYVTGYYVGIAIFGNTTLTYGGVFLVKLNSYGVWQWAIGVQGPNTGNDVAVDANGNICITGRFKNTASFGTTNITSQGGYDIFVARLSQEYLPPNNPPNPPSITGPATGRVDVPTNYNFTATDPDDDEVYYLIDWGDQTNSNWLGPYASGYKIIQSHTWTKKGTYTIKAKARDTNGSESDWRQLSVTMPCSYNIPMQWFFERLFERFPHAFPILRYLLR